MRPFAGSIAIFAALSLLSSAPGAEPGKGHEAVAAASVFADSFGLNLAEKAPPAKQTGAASPTGLRQLPAADSFKLNNLEFSAVADCPAAKPDAKSAQPARKCIEI